MGNIYFHKDYSSVYLNPDSATFEVVERKFRGHPDSLADMVAHSFVQRYIHNAWDRFPDFMGTIFPNFSADKITLSGASINSTNGKLEILKPIHALLIGKITEKVGEISIDVDAIFKESLENIFTRSLGHDDYKKYMVRKTYSVSLAGSDHSSRFYQPDSVNDLINILTEETHANDTVYVVAYSPLSVTEKLSIYLDNLTASDYFHNAFPEIGSDIKVLIRRRISFFEITMCLPVFPEKVINNGKYKDILDNATKYLYDEISLFLRKFPPEFGKVNIQLRTNTKDTKNKKYYAIWGTALSKGDIGVVGRGNRQQGFISGLRPSTNEAMSGKNPNHFSGVIYQLIAEDISQTIFLSLGLKNIVYITANNGDPLANPNSIDVLLSGGVNNYQESIKDIIKNTLGSISKLRMDYINSDPYERFMNPKSYLL